MCLLCVHGCGGVARLRRCGACGQASIKEHGLRHEVWSPAEVSARFPVFRMQDDEVAVFEKDAALLVPERFVV